MTLIQPQINLLPKQTLAWDYLIDDPIITEVGYGGGAGGGKTRLGCYVCIYMAITYPTSRGGIGRKELKNLKRTTLVSMFEVLHECGLQPVKHYRYNQQESIITLFNGSEFVLFDLAYQPNDPLYTRFGSYELTYGWADESNEAPSTALDILRTRVGRRNTIEGKTIKPFFLETFNPNKGHVYHRFYKPYKNGTLPKYRVFVPALTKDNPYLSESYIQTLERADPITRERLLHGNFEYDDDPSKLCNYDSIQDIFSNFADKGRKYIVADIARLGKDKTIIYVWEGLNVIERIEIAKDTLDNQLAVFEGLREKHQIPKSCVLVDEDGVGGGLADFGGYNGFVANSRPIDTTAGSLWTVEPHQKLSGVNYKNLKSQCAFFLAKLINEGKIAFTATISSDVKERIIEDLDSIKQDKVDSDSSLAIIRKDKQKELLGRSPDDGDTFIMRMLFELKPASIQFTQDMFYV